MTWKDRYHAAHKQDFEKRYPTAFKDGHYFKPTMPKVSTSNGLTNAICNFINWNGGIGNRINVSGRLVGGQETTASGATFEKKKWIKSSTLKGTADIDATLPNGKNAKIEIKVGKDRPRPEQIKMQERYRNIGVTYEFISDMDQFLALYDLLMVEQKLF